MVAGTIVEPRRRRNRLSARVSPTGAKVGSQRTMHSDPSATPPAPLSSFGRAEPVIRTIAMPADTNPAGDIFGGWLMANMDLAAGNIATHHARGRAATVAVDGMAFLSPVLVGDEVSFYGTIVESGRTSMKIKIEAWRRKREDDVTVKVTEATFVFVAIGEDRRPRVLPGYVAPAPHAP